MLGDYKHFATLALTSANHVYVTNKTFDLIWLGMARSLHFNSSQKCSMELRSGLCASQSSFSSSTKLYAFGQVPFSLHLPIPNLSFGLQYGDSSLQRTRFHCSRFQWRRVLHHYSRRLAFRFLHATRFSTQFYELVWPTRSCCCFHFTITALTVDRDSSSWAEIWRTDLLERWHPMTVPGWKSLRSSGRAILLSMFVYGDRMAVCLILYSCQQRVWLK